ncbi:hypothetical protein SAMN04488005_1246 [Yoonia tamlensis]|uniref:Porin n=1 Tax=Yoonia tamlensis TaxID=390270 RepID=A0A1I6G8M0_9RHOB|nr:hypothetical protein [Yoonia tamlensis]SFR38529.1 hypothetical protein SAMN04488005_1246 [Yoonia tamlensis]
MFGFMRSRFAALSCVFCLATPIAAQTAADGWLSVGQIASDDLATGYVFGDFTLSASGGHWGAEIGMFGVVGRLHETYAAVSWQDGQHKLELGFPRPAYDRFAVSGLTRVMPRRALESIATTRSRATAGVFTESEFLPYGLAYRRADLVVSLHGVPDTDIVVAGLGGRKTYAHWQLDYALEAVSQNNAIDWNAKAQAAVAAGRWDMGVGIYANDANAAALTAEIFAAVTLADHLSVTALLRQSDSDDPLAGAKLTYAHDSGLLAEAAIAGDRSNGTSVAVSLGYQF